MPKGHSPARETGTHPCLLLPYSQQKKNGTSLSTYPHVNASENAEHIHNRIVFGCEEK